MTETPEILRTALDELEDLRISKPMMELWRLANELQSDDVHCAVRTIEARIVALTEQLWDAYGHPE